MALSDGLVGYWSPWLGSSGYRLLDRTPYRNHGTLTNMDAGTDWVGATVNGRTGYALDFNGTNNSVQTSLLGSSISFNTTVSSWIYPFRGATTIERGFLWSVAKSGLPTFDFQIFTDNNIYVGWFASGNDRRIVVSKTSAGWTQNQWQLFTFVSSPSFGSLLYRNGIQVGSNSNANFVAGFTTETFQIGSNTVVSASSAFFGRIAETTIHNRALTTSEIATIYRLGPCWYQQQRRRSLGYVPAATTNRRRRILIGASE